MKLSIIVPVLNEAKILPVLFDQFHPLQRQGVEILIADGGSQDGSVVLAEIYGYQVLKTGRGRALQMNLAAAQATGDILLFLHADTLLPANADLLISSSLASSYHDWGRFNISLVGTMRMLSVVSFFINLRSSLTGIATGDQAVFVKRQVFEALGGFPEQPLMEDIELCKRLLSYSKPVCLKQRVQSSGRRWEKYGVWTTIFLMWRLRWAYWRGVSPEILIKEYQ